MTLDELVELLRRYRFYTVDERELQQAINNILMRHFANVWDPPGPILPEEMSLIRFLRESFQREVRLGPRDRIDFLVGKIGIEIKVAGSAASAERQMARYAKHETIDALILVTDRLQAGAIPETLNGKPVRVVQLLGGLR